MSLYVRRRLLTSVVPFLGVSIAASAQEPRRLTQPDSIPVELAGALMSAGGFGAEPQILVGAFPGWMSALIPVSGGARVLGSAFLSTTTVGVVVTSQEPAAAIEQIKPELEKLGWTPPPPQMSFGGGFRNPPLPMMGNAPVPTAVTFLSLCGGDQQMLTVRASRRPSGSEVVFRITPAGTVSTCHPPPPPPPPPNAMRTVFPTLYNPAGAGDYAAVRDCQVDGSTALAQLRTPMPPQQILDHYAKQLQDSGWSLASGTTSMGRTWTKPDSTGAPQEVSVIVVTLTRDSTCHHLSMQVRGAKRP